MLEQKLGLAGDSFDCILDVANFLLHFAFDLVGQALGLLFFAADDFASGLLDFTGDFLHFTFDLIFVHDGSSL